MPTTLNFKDVIDQPVWRPESPLLASTAAGVSMANDYLGTIFRDPYIYLLRSSTALDIFDTRTGDWLPLASPALAGTFGAGATAVYHASQGPRGTLTGTNTVSSINLGTTLPSAVGINQLANSGRGIGFKIRIIGSGVGSSGKIEERVIIGNTAGSTPTVFLDSPLSFTPTSADRYEILSGRLYMLGAGTNAAGIWKYYDCATNGFTTVTNTGLPATVGTDSAAVALSELYVPNNMAPGAGFITGSSTYNAASAITCIVAQSASSITIVGSGMPSLCANEYRNFQIRIVEDLVNTTAVGQRGRIASHTGGSSAAFTLTANLPVAPSLSAKFVIENDDDKIMLRTSAAVLMYNYNINANTWETTTWAAPLANGAGVIGAQAFGPVRDITNNHRHSFVYFVRGGATASIDVLDIAGAATGSWSNGIAYNNSGQTFTTGTCGAYDPVTLDGRFLYININATQRFCRFDLKNRVMTASTYLRFPQGVALVGNKLACGLLVDGNTKLNVLYHATNTQPQMFGLVTPTT